MGCIVYGLADSGRVILRSKPFIASELGGCADPCRVLNLKFTRAKGAVAPMS